MKEIRLCWAEGTSPPASNQRHCGPWLVKSDASLEVLGTMMLAGCAAFGPGTHWLMERDAIWPSISLPMPL